MTSDFTSIIIVHYAQPLGIEILNVEMESILNFTNPEPFEIILVDNSDGDISEDNVETWKQHEFPIEWIRNTENVGWVKGCNQGIEAAEGEFIVLMNNDVIVSLKWLTILKDVWRHGINTGLRVATVGPQAMFADHGQDLRDHPMLPNPTLSSSMTHFCAFFWRKVFEDIGTLDPLFSKIDGYFSDDDLNLRLAQSGYVNLIAPLTVLHLKPHFHRGEYESRCKEIFEKIGPALFVEKWGDIGQYWLRHKQLPGNL